MNAFGLEMSMDFSLPGASRSSGPRRPDVVLRYVDRSELAALEDEPRYLRYLHFFEGCPYAMLEGADGDVLFHYRHRALFHLSSDLNVLRCAPATGENRAWERVLMDTIFWTVSLLRGFELVHASAVRTPAGLVCFIAPSGGGKTALAAECIRRGATLFSDDILALDGSADAVVAYPGPPLMNLSGAMSLSDVGNATLLDRFDDEQWVELDARSQDPQPVAAVVLAERVGGIPVCSKLPASTITLLPHLITFPHLRHRARRQFELAGALAATSAVLRLTADPSAPASRLVELVEEKLDLR